MGFFDIKISPAVPVAVAGAIVISTVGHYVAKYIGVTPDTLQGVNIIAGIIGAAVGALVGRQLK